MPGVSVKSIYKYKLDPSTHPAMPKGANVLHAHEQHGEIYIWAVVDDDAQMVTHRFRVVPTGVPLPDVVLDGSRYVGTVHINEVGQLLVFHIFDLGEA